MNSGIQAWSSSTHLTLHPTCTFHPRILKDFWIQNSRLFPDFFSKQKFLFPEPCLTIPLPAALASPPLSYHPYKLPSIPFPLHYHTLCLRITIPLPLHYHPLPHALPFPSDMPYYHPLLPYQP